MKRAEQIASECTDFTGYVFSEQVAAITSILLKWESEIREDQKQKTLGEVIKNFCSVFGVKPKN